MDTKLPLPGRREGFVPPEKQLGETILLHSNDKRATNSMSARSFIIPPPIATVTQTTSNSTAVTLNAPRGYINLFQAAIPAMSNVTFNMNNKLILGYAFAPTEGAIESRIRASIVSTAAVTPDPQPFLVLCVGVDAGYARINIRNVSATAYPASPLCLYYEIIG